MRKRWLDIPSLSQGNEANEKVKEESMKWCGRASSSMVYNYYQTVLGNTSKYILNDQGKGDLLYSDGSVAAEGYVLSAPLNAALKGWKRSALYPRADRNLPLSTMQIATVLQPVLDSIDRNNPLVAYTALSKNLSKARHIVVISGYREESDGEIWLLIDDPATMCDTRAEKEKTDYIGIENLEILDPGLWYERGSRYWLRASRLFEKNDFSESSDDLWCDHHDRPGFVVYVNDAVTADSQYSHFEETPRSSLPMLASGIEDICPTPEKIDSYFTHTEKDFSGGYFPVGANTTWHSGIHILGEEGATVHAVADGTVICARMPWEDREQDRLKFGSRNFVLIRHGRGDQAWYSLYYHLKSVDMLNDAEAEKIEWLKNQQLEISLGNFRTVPTTKGNKEICCFRDGHLVDILDKKAAPWYKVQRPEDNMTGYVYYDPGRMKEFTGISRSRAELFRAEGVRRIDVPIKAGDIIGFVGEGITIENNSIVKKPILHWSVFSSELVSGSWKYMQDDNDDFTCDCKALVNMIDQKIEDENGVFQADGHLSREEIEEFFKDEEKAKKLRRYAFKFKTEWAVEWEKHAATIKKAGMRPNVPVMNLYNWWEEAIYYGLPLPSNGHIWHYNPIHFLERKLYPCVSAPFMAASFAADSSFLLPSAYTLVERIGSYTSKHRIAEITIIGMSGVGDDSKTDPDLSEARATSITLFLNDQKSAWVDRFSYKTKAKTNQGVWNHYERQLLLAYFGTYTGDAVDENTPEQQNAVRAFQNRYGLTVDGDAGPATLGKMYELIREKMGNPKCPECCIVAGNDTHQNHGELLAHVMLWHGKQFPAVSEYSTDPENVYNQWLDSITMCIDAEPCEYYEEPLVLYSPQRNEYILVKDVEKLENEIQTMDDILEKLEKAREEKDLSAQGEALSKASQEAVSLLSQDIGETLDPKKNIEELIALDKERFSKVKKRPIVYARVSKLDDKGKWVKADDKEAKKAFKKFERMTIDSESDDYGSKELFDCEKEGGWPVDWKFTLDKEKLKDNKYFDACAEVQFFRYAVGASACAQWDTKKRKFNINADAKASYMLAEGKATGAYHLPCKEGFDLFELVKKIPLPVTEKEKKHEKKIKESIIKKGAQLRFKLKVTMEGYAFAGASAAAALSLPQLDLENFENPKAALSLDGDAFAGASAEGSLAIEALWSKTEKDSDFQSIAFFRCLGAARAGVGIGGCLDVAYQDGYFIFHFNLTLTVGVGLKGEYESKCDTQAGFKILSHITRSVNYHYLANVAEDAFEVFRLFGLAQFIDTGYEITTQMWEAKDTAVQAYNGAKDKIADLYNRISDAVEERDIVQLYEEVQAARREAQEKLAELKEATEKIEKNLTRVMQSARDFFDGDLSRYDVEKYKNLIVSKINNNVDLIKENCPEVLGSVVKVLSYGDKVSDDVQSAVVKILENTESSHEVKWILRQTVDIYKTTREKGLKHGTDKFKEVAGDAIDLGLKKLDEKLEGKKRDFYTLLENYGISF